MQPFIEKQGCSGCHACLNVCPQSCIKMESDDEGFRYPKVNDDICTRCGLCAQVCPALLRTNDMTQAGKMPQAFACFCNDDSVRLSSSSGGIFTLLAKQIISDGGVVYGARFDQHFSVVHGYVETVDELERLRGSKYVQSHIDNTLREAEIFLKRGRHVLFSGTPCQIAGLRSFLQQDYNNLLCVDIVCHGVPSPLVWESYVRYREEKAKAKTEKIFFRGKDNGWKKFAVQFLFRNGERYGQSFDRDPFMRAFLADICLRPSCHQCNFKSIIRQSDITLADFWGIQYVAPEMDDDKGTSLALLNSGKGREIFNHIRGELKCKQVDVESAIKYNPAAIKSAYKNKRREEFFKSLNSKYFIKIVNRYCGDSIFRLLYKSTKALIRRFTKLP